MEEGERYKGDYTEHRQLEIDSVGATLPLVYRALYDFRPDLLFGEREGTAPVAVLGGAHAGNNTLDQFERFCEVFGFESWVVDHDTPNVGKLKQKSRTSKVLEGDLESVDRVLGDELKRKVDLVVCDFTIDFMPDESVVEFGESVGRVLGEKGLVIAGVDGGILPKPIRRWLLAWKNKIRKYPRNHRETASLLSSKGELKKICAYMTDQNQYLVMARKESKYKEFEGPLVGVYEEEAEGELIVAVSERNS